MPRRITTAKLIRHLSAARLRLSDDNTQRGLGPGMLRHLHRIDRFLRLPHHKQTKRRANLLHRCLAYLLLSTLIDAVRMMHPAETP